MIVVSGVLVLVALVFLVIGLFQEGLGFIWASIITSVVAGVFLLLGALQRRGTPATATDTGTTGSDMLERVTAVSVRSRDEASDTGDTTEADEPAAAASGALVSVVPNRPRYHTPSCRFLAGRGDVEQIPVDEAQGEGYTACGVCKPDAAIAAAAESPEPSVDEQAADTTDMAGDTIEDTAAIDTSDTELAPVTTATRARKAPAKKAAAATKATARTAGTTATGAAADVTAAPAKATKAAKPAAKKAAGAATVVAVPDRGKFHTPTCRFSSAPGALEMSRTQASRQGLVACGVCKP